MQVTVQFPKEQEAKFHLGSYFLNDRNKLRRIIPVTEGKVGILDIENGCLAISKTMSTANDIAKHYSNHNGKITKVNVKEIIVERTMEVLEVNEN